VQVARSHHHTPRHGAGSSFAAAVRNRSKAAISLVSLPARLAPIRAGPRHVQIRVVCWCLHDRHGLVMAFEDVFHSLTVLFVGQAFRIMLMQRPGGPVAAAEAR
jgi:hypothetical protein